MINSEARVATVSTWLCGLSYQQVQQSFERKFRKPAPTTASIRFLVNKFKRTGSALNEKHSGRPQTSEDVQSIQQATEQSPCASIRHLSNQLDISKTTVWRVLHFKLKKRAHHLQLRDYLSNTFRNTWLGRAAPKHWVPHSPNLTLLRFFAWGFTKSKVYKTLVPDLHELWQCNYEAAQAALTPNMLRDVFRAAVESW
jgi:transposase